MCIDSFSATVFTMDSSIGVKHEEDPLSCSEIKTEPHVSYKFSFCVFCYAFIKRDSNTDCQASYSWTYPFRSWNCNRKIGKVQVSRYWPNSLELIYIMAVFRYSLKSTNLDLLFEKKEMLPEEWKEGDYL